MKNILIFSFIVFITLSFWSCNKCRYLDCIFSDYCAQFRIVSKANGNDLIFGINSIYDKNKIKFFSLNGNDTTFFQHSPVPRYLNSDRDSILKVYYNSEPKGLTFIKFNNVDVDTLTITYLTKNTECCGNVTTISKFLYNNTNEIGSNDEVRELKK